MCCSAQIWVFSTASIAGVVGLILAIWWPHWSEEIMNSMLPVAPGSILFNHWVETPVPLYMTFRLYNWTNPEEVANPNVKPHFTEHGPYVFRDYKEKKNLVWDDDASTVTYVDKREWHFQEHLSGGKLSDVITVPHFATVGLVNNVKKSSSSMKKIVNFFLNREGGSLTMTATAIEWLFDGFYDDLFDFAEKLHSPLVPIYSSDFAWFLWRNGSTGAEGNFTIHTGKKDLQQLGDIKLWNATANTGLWDGECGTVNGTTGELMGSGKPFDTVLSMFIPEVPRFINLFPKEKVKYKGVDAYLYKTTDQTFDNGYIAPDTKCFCIKNNGCPKLGATDLGPITFGSPVYASHPHFYFADPSYLANTTGLSPNEEAHGSYLIVEPILGAPLLARGQAMISLYVEKDEAMDILSTVAHNFYAPLLVVSIEAEITDHLLKFVKLGLSASDIGQITGIVLAVVGIIMLCIATWLTITKRWNCGKKAELVESPTASVFTPATLTDEAHTSDAIATEEMASKTAQPTGEIVGEVESKPITIEGEVESGAIATQAEKKQE